MADFTILGDVNQTANPFYHYETLSILREIFGEDSKYIELIKLIVLVQRLLNMQIKY